ncbi:hypothetical protein [Chitinophaga sp. Cy-1792]|uniref:hypothetical protein n=1 Tax=Chitinophaga sp. Cy-1792 TaxID=2608339 RepID=UPI00141EEFC9|nr:hypothetical protein [Chitinophaga sp. Cy-1792]NIG54411.1 hypothetical protein [Chitinophaga sp. Cy-1792]
MNRIVCVLPLITGRNYRLLMWLRWSGLVMLGLAFYCVNYGPKCWFLILVPLATLFWHANLIIKEYTIIGSIYLSPYEIVLSYTTGHEMRYLLEDLKDIDVSINSVSGELIGGKSFFIKTGVRNYIMFRYAGEKNEVEFLLEDQHVTPLSQLLKLWKQNGLKFKLQNISRENFS